MSAPDEVKLSQMRIEAIQRQFETEMAAFRRNLRHIEGQLMTVRRSLDTLTHPEARP